MQRCPSSIKQSCLLGGVQLLVPGRRRQTPLPRGPRCRLLVTVVPSEGFKIGNQGVDNVAHTLCMTPS
jgi:hypothetical protein